MSRRGLAAIAAAVLALVAVVVAVDVSRRASTPEPRTPAASASPSSHPLTIAPVSPSPKSTPGTVVVAAGDIACDRDNGSFHTTVTVGTSCGAGGTAKIAAGLNPSVVLALGDLQYDCGDATDWSASYAPTWGKLKAITRPAIGNHEYGRGCGRNSAGPYFDYWGAAAGPRYQGWYSFDVGGWHLIALNSECDYGTGSWTVGGCQTGSPQETWLRADLAAHPAACTLAYWHEPRFSSSVHGDAVQMTAIWDDLRAAHADVVLNGHNHVYERFDPLGAIGGPSTRQPEPVYQSGTLDPAGIREFLVGTGGRDLYAFPGPVLTGEKIRYSRTLGVLSLTLHGGSYDWAFHSSPWRFVVDSGHGTCH